ncbi:UNVERIFIED_CONTAM: hypothetical protein NCL1_09618 [Trichonephila clavipes]
MPGSTTFFGPTAEDNEIVKKSESSLMSSRQPPPVAPRTTSVSIQSWQSATSGSESNYGDNRHARSASMDSLESSGSSSSGGGSSIANQQSTTIEYIPTRTAGKVSKLPSHNPLQFVKVQSALYKKAEQQIKLTKEVKITREALKEGEEEWQSNLDNWKSRRRKVSEKVIQRAEEMRQIEAEEQLRQDQYLQQQRKIKKFSEIVEKRSSRSYNLDLYIGQGNDSGLGGTPEPDDIIDSHNSILRSDTSEGMTSEAESIDSDIHKLDKMHEKEPPKVPQKPQMRLKKERTVEEFDNSITSTNHHFTSHLPNRDFDNFSSAEPSDVEGHTGDSETVSSEEDISYLADGHKSEPTIINSLPEQNQENCSINNGISKENISSVEETDYQLAGWQKHSFSICIKPGDNRGFGFTLKGGKDQGCSAYIDCVTKYSPADTSGIKEGDKIISLNGELAADYSHASLIFSVKQAVYTGILDLVVYRPEENAPVPSEMKKPTNRKSSFAEKLALFSSGVNSTPNPEESKASITSPKSNEGKSESLVLRRRSAFENGKKENVVHRRSSCLSQGISKSNAENLEKRLSVDLSQYNLSENGTVKKGPPPPVPVKPKLKPKTFNDFPKTDFKTNGYNDEEHANTNGFTHTSNDIPSNDDILGSHSDTEFSSKAGNEIHLQELELENNHKLSSDSFLNQELNEGTEDVQFSSYMEQDNSLNPTNNSPEILNGSHTETENIENKTRGLSLNEISIPPPFDDFHTLNTENEELNSESEFKTKVFSNDEQTMRSESLISVSFTSSKQFHENIKSVRETDPAEELEDDLLSDVTEHKSSFNEQNNYLNNDSLQTNISHVPVLHNFEEPIDSSDLSTIMNDIKLIDNDEIAEGDQFKNEDNFCLTESKSLSPVDDSDENVNNIQVNSSPLCLPLEKIDEDDVISASTTTSSETPDTETVIETLPSNLSPLPNDESNGEESSKPLDCHEKDVEYVAETSDPSFEAPESNCLDNPEYITDFDNVPFQNEFSCNTSEGYVIENIYPDDEDDEYCRELDESIDQITSLDVIDEIEQQLMHQLEQQGEAFEEMDEGLTAQLEQDINNQWLYFSDDTELLDDLTPRNLEPPKEPPPPPPPPELDDAADQKILPIMTRTNSTKRIKKELWRRRSDFLGLESPEGIDVDKILPPPPALEEILKQEREQTQWLEKRLSLAETDTSAPLYTNDSIIMESQDISQSDYSEYFLEDPDVSKVTVEDINEQWKENSVEQSVFETSELQYAPPSDVTIPVSDGSRKINESPQQKAKQNLHNLGAAPKAKIMDSNKWITERVTSVSKKSVEPVFRQTTYNQNYWLTQDERKRNIQISDNLADRRYSMPPCQNSHPGVTVRTWGDREYEFQKQRPRSAVWNSPPVAGDIYDSYSHKQDILRTHSLDGSAMGIEALRLYFHIECFRCCICRMQLGNGSCGTDVQVKHDQLYCPNCFTVH